MDKEKSCIVSAIALNSIFGNEPKLIHGIIDAFGSAEAVFALSQNERANLFGPYSKTASKINDSALERAEKEYDRLRAKGYEVISLFDDPYPSLLKECPDSPLVLYVRGKDSPKQIFSKHQFISIVGTRDFSPYGREWCERIVKRLSLAGQKPTIVSGLAIGVDICAHMAALAYGLPTIAVSPVGIEDIYPRQHNVAAEKICSHDSCAIITDFPPGTPAMPYTFLRRNRIIAGMSSATIIIESKIRGGAAMTARLASGYGRSVFALPGRIDDIRSAACNALIAGQMAEAIVDLDSLPEILGLGPCKEEKRQDSAVLIMEKLSELDDAGKRLALAILGSIKNKRGISLEELCSIHSESYNKISEMTNRLEAAGIISTDLLQNCYINVKNA